MAPAQKRSAVRRKSVTLGLEALEGRVMMAAGPMNGLKQGFRPVETRLEAPAPAVQMKSVAPAAAPLAQQALWAATTPVTVGSNGSTFAREDLAEYTNGTSPVKRSRPAAATVKVPKPPQGIEVVKPPKLTGTTKQVELTIGTANGRTQQPLGLNVGSMSAWGQGNAVNNMITQGGGFELANGRVILHAGSGSTSNKLVVDGDWLWDGLGRSAMVGQTLVGSTGSNKHGVWQIVDAQAQVDGNGAATGRTVVTIGGTFAVTPVAADSFYVELMEKGRHPLSDGTSTWGNATIARDLTVARNGEASAVVKLGAGAPADNGAVLTYYFGADATAGRNVLRQGHTYQFTYWAKAAVAPGGTAVASLNLWQGQNGGNINTTLIADGQWHQYTLTVVATNPVVYENGIGAIHIKGANATVHLDDVRLVDLNDELPGTVLSKETVSLIKEYGFKGLRFWHGEMRWARLDDVIGKAESRPMIASPWETFDAQFGLPEMLQLAKVTGTTPWIVIPTMWTPTDVRNLMEYLGGSAQTTYGAKRIAEGQVGSWFDALPGIRIEAGNESWNGTFGPNSYYPFEPYWERAEEMFQNFKADPLYGSTGGKLELIVNGWQWVPWYTEQSIKLTPSADAVDISAYTSGPTSQMPLNQLLGGVLTQQMADNVWQLPQSIFGKKVYVYEESMGELQGTVSKELESAYATSLGAGLAVMRNAMQLSRDYGISVQNLFTMFQRGLTMPNGYALGHYGIFTDLGTAATNPRPIALGAKLLNQASGQILSSSLSSGWVVDSTSTIPAARTTQAADSLVTFDGKNLVVTLFNNTIADLENTNFHFVLPSVVNGKVATADWSKATYQVLTGPTVGSNNETTAPVTIVGGTYTHGLREVYAALPGHSMGSLVIPLVF